MFDTLGLIWMSWWCMTLFYPLHADLWRMERICSAETEESPITNLTWNWRRMELSWESSKNFPSYTCMMTSGDRRRRKKVENRKCWFSMENSLRLQGGISFTIEVPNTNISKHCRFIPEVTGTSAACTAGMLQM